MRANEDTRTEVDLNMYCCFYIMTDSNMHMKPVL